MDKRVWPAFRLFYALIVLFGWWVAYRIFMIRGIYPGSIPEAGGESLAYYVYHPLMGLINFMTVLAVTGGITIGGTIGSMQMLLRKSAKINFILVSIMLNATWILLYVLDWARII